MKLSIAISALALTTGIAFGGATVTHEDSFLAFGAEMPYGDGNANSNFTIARNTDAFGALEIGLKAKERFIGNLPTDGAGRYFANAGSPDNDGLSSWNIDYAFALSQTAIPSNYNLVLSIDFDSGYGTQSWVTLNITNALAAGPFTPVGGDSQNLGFGFWGTDIPFVIDASGHITFDADAAGEYDVKLTLHDSAGAFLAESAIVVEVVPAPGPIALLGLGGLIATRRRR